MKTRYSFKVGDKVKRHPMALLAFGMETNIGPDGRDIFTYEILSISNDHLTADLLTVDGPEGWETDNNCAHKVQKGCYLSVAELA